MTVRPSHMFIRPNLRGGRSCASQQNRGVYFRFGSKADILQCNRHVRFTPNSDIDCVFRHVRFGPKADMRQPYSITSSAAVSRVGGNVRPSALAALRLSTNSNFVDCTTG